MQVVVSLEVSNWVWIGEPPHVLNKWTLFYHPKPARFGVAQNEEAEPPHPFLSPDKSAKDFGKLDEIFENVESVNERLKSVRRLTGGAAGLDGSPDLP